MKNLPPVERILPAILAGRMPTCETAAEKTAGIRSQGGKGEVGWGRGESLSTQTGCHPVTNNKNFTKMKKSMSIGGTCLSLFLSLFSCTSSSEEQDVIEKNVFQFREPLTSWEATAEEVRDYMSGYEVTSVSTYSISFSGKDGVLAYLYAFSSIDCTLSYAMVSFDLSVKDEVLRFLKENYQRREADKDKYIYVDDASKTYIWTSEDQALYLTYMSAGSMSR